MSAAKIPTPSTTVRTVHRAERLGRAGFFIATVVDPKVTKAAKQARTSAWMQLEVRDTPPGFPLPSTGRRHAEAALAAQAGRGIEGEGWLRRKTVEWVSASTVSTPHPGPLPVERRGRPHMRPVFSVPQL